MFRRSWENGKKNVHTKIIIPEKENEVNEAIPSNIQEVNVESNKIKNIKGEINAMCISPDKEQIAFYCASNSAIYVYSSDLKPSSKTKITFKLDKIQPESIDIELTKEDLQEHQALFAFDNINFQFLFCGSSRVTLCNQR